MRTDRTKNSATSPNQPPLVPVRTHDDYVDMRSWVAEHFCGVPDGPLFRAVVDGKELWNAWLTALPQEEWQQHQCHSCQRFVEHYGNLVYVDSDGRTHSAIWDHHGTDLGIFDAAFLIAQEMVEASPIAGAHASSEKSWGTPSTRDGKRPGHAWYHLHVEPNAKQIHKDRTKTAQQRAAELDEEYAILMRALGEYDEKYVTQAAQIASTGGLRGTEKIAERLKWFAGLYQERRTLSAAAFRNRIRHVSATAPVGWCHVKSSIVGPLLDDLVAGRTFEDIKRAHDAKMDPLAYRRPQAAPSAGNIARAEKLFETLGLAPALRRRMARLEDVVQYALWTPTQTSTPKPGGLFSHLTPKDAAPKHEVIATAPVMTWEKFARTVLPTARRMQVHVPTTNALYHALTTASDPAAPPIIMWDRVEDGVARNPVSWYVYHHGSPATQWNLVPGVLVDVTAAIPTPPEFGGQRHPAHAPGVLLLLANCRDLRARNAGLALFPEVLRSDLNEVRSVIEAHSKSGQLEGVSEASACGLAIRALVGSAGGNVKIRVYADGATTDYVVDRLD